MVSRENLESRTVAQLKVICKNASIRGYSKLKKANLIELILSNLDKIDHVNVDSGKTVETKPRVQTKKVYSREESEKNIEKNKKLMKQRADVAGITVKELKGLDKNATKLPSIKKTSKKLPDSATITKKPTPKEPTPKKPAPKKSMKSTTSPSKKTTPRKIVKREAVVEKKETRFQDLPIKEQKYILKNKMSGSGLKILYMNEKDFLKQSRKKLDKLEDTLSLEQSRLTPYQPTDKLLRNFIQESIDLIRHAREEQLNKEETRYFETSFKKIVEKNSKKIKKIMEKLDNRVYTEMDIAREIVDKINFKPPFSNAYLATRIKERLVSKSLFIDS
ncbi:MAG: hypothetical protein ACTSUE_11045 [Promethearchaeota archaeon]